MVDMTTLVAEKGGGENRVTFFEYLNLRPKKNCNKFNRLLAEKARDEYSDKGSS